jgi:hypothetical protein
MPFEDPEIKQLGERNLYELETYELIKLGIIAAKLLGKYGVYMRHGIVPIEENMDRPENAYNYVLQKGEAIINILAKRLKDPSTHKSFLEICGSIRKED